MNNSHLTLTELFDLEQLQRLQDGFAAATGIPAMLVDVGGRRVTKPSPGTDHCEQKPEAGESGERVVTGRDALAAALLADPPFAEQCRQLGLTAIVVPIRIDGASVGSWVIDHVILGAPEPGLAGKLAHRLGMDVQGAEALVRDTPVVSLDEYNKLHSLLLPLSALLGKLGRTARQVGQLEREVRGIANEIQIRDQVLDRFIQSSGDAMYICDYYTGEILMVNESYSRQAGEPMYKLLGRKCWDVNGLSEGSFCSFCPRAFILDDNSRPGQAYTWEYYNEKFGLWLRCTHQGIIWAGGRTAHMVTQQDVTKEHRIQSELERLAYYDTETALPNNLLLSQRIRSAFERGERWNHTLICIYLPSLRLFSDIYGMDAEHEIVVNIVAWIRSNDFGNTELYRLGRDEFCLTLLDAGQEHALDYAERIRARFDTPWQVTLKGNGFSFIGSVSVSILRVPATLLSHEDVLLLITRTMGRARRTEGLCVYDEEMDCSMRKHLQLELNLRHSVNLGMEGFWVCYQPIVELSSGLWKGVEALCRWNAPDQGAVPPLVFIKEAERQGLIASVGRWVLESAIRQCKELGLDAIDGFFLSVNISPLQMMEKDFADIVLQVLEDYDFPGASLNLEVTESEEMTFNSFTLGMIERLRGVGVRFALDDFGTGYSSFQNLKNLPVDFLKTEREFIEGIEHDSYMQYFLYIISEIAHATGMKLIVEGVETLEQLKTVRVNGADYIQGYYFSKPIPLDDLRERKDRFTTPEEVLVPLTGEILNIRKWLAGKSAYELTPNLFMLLNRCVEILFFKTEADGVIDEILAVAGEAYKPARACVFVRGRLGVFSNMYEWCDTGVEPQKALFESVDVLEESPSLLEAFSNHGMIVASDIRLLPPDIYRGMRRSGDIQSVALMPMFDEQRLIGFIGFEHLTHHAWSPEEIVMLWNLSMCVAHAVNKENLKIQVKEERNMLESVLRSSALGAYVSDLETDEILWANDVLESACSGGDSLVGRKCYRVFYGRDERCGFCKKPYLAAYPAVGHFAYERYNAYLDRHYSAYETLIPWVGGLRVHMAYALDTTETVKAQREMETLRVLDMQTGVLNRGTALATLTTACDVALAENGDLSIAVINVNHLRQINARYGHQTGDQALVHTVEALRNGLGKTDTAGRLSGDEFVILFSGLGKREVKECLVKVQELLRGSSLLPDMALTFSYGIARLSEVPAKQGGPAMEQLLALAETRMRQDKDDAARPG